MHCFYHQKKAIQLISTIPEGKDKTFLSNREGTGTPLQYSCLDNPMGGGAW